MQGLPILITWPSTYFTTDKLVSYVVSKSQKALHLSLENNV